MPTKRWGRQPTVKVSLSRSTTTLLSREGNGCRSDSSPHSHEGFLSIDSPIISLLRPFSLRMMMVSALGSDWISSSEIM